MRVLVSGARGFVGGALVDRLSADGHGVRALCRARRGASPPVAGELYPWHVETAPPPGEALEGVDAVVHLAGEPVAGLWTRRKRAAIENSRVLGTRKLVAGLAALPDEGRPKTLVSASAVGYYGERGDAELTEDEPAGDAFLARVCARWEHEAAQAAALGVRVVSLRIGIVLGSGGGALRSMLPAFHCGLGGSLGSGRQWWSWIERGDLVELIVFALESELAGPVNAVAPGVVRQRTFAQTLGRVLGRPTLCPAPAWALRLIAGGFSSELLSSKRVVPARLEELGFRFTHPELEGALRAVLEK